jgi:hypothetical protein
MIWNSESMMVTSSFGPGETRERPRRPGVGRSNQEREVSMVTPGERAGEIAVVIETAIRTAERSACERMIVWAEEQLGPQVALALREFRLEEEARDEGGTWKST